MCKPIRTRRTGLLDAAALRQLRPAGQGRRSRGQRLHRRPDRSSPSLRAARWPSPTRVARFPARSPARPSGSSLPRSSSSGAPPAPTPGRRSPRTRPRRGRLSFVTTALADGTYDLRAVSFNSANAQLRSAAHTGIPIDNTRPPSSPRAPPTARSSARRARLADGQRAARLGRERQARRVDRLPDVSGTSITVNREPPEGPHALDGLLVDNAGQRAHFRVASRSRPPAPAPRRPSRRTRRRIPRRRVDLVGGDATVSCRADRTQRSPPPGHSGAGATGSSSASPRPRRPTYPGAAFRAGGRRSTSPPTWAVAGDRREELRRAARDHPRDHERQGRPGDVRERRLAGDSQVAVPGVCRPPGATATTSASDGVHVLTRHLTKFALLFDSRAPSPPASSGAR